MEARRWLLNLIAVPSPSRRSPPLNFSVGHARLISAADRRAKRGAETAGLWGGAVVAVVVAAAWLRFLGHLRLPVTSFTSVTHSSLGGGAVGRWGGGAG